MTDMEKRQGFDAEDVRSTELVEQAYGGDNYKIEYTDAKGRKALICFSGNGLYFPNDEETFTSKVVNGDRYEWEHLCQSKEVRRRFQKIIYLRDVWKSWYAWGISSAMDSIDAVEEFLSRETKGYEVTTVGNSAGGYAAALFGMKLHAEMVLDFSGQFELYQKDAPQLDPIWQQAWGEAYRSLVPMMKESDTPVFFYLPDASQQDLVEYDLVKDCDNLYAIKIMSAYHGTTVYGVNYPKLLSMDIHQMNRLADRLKGQSISRTRFLLLSEGILKGGWMLGKMLINKRKQQGSMQL